MSTKTLSLLIIFYWIVVQKCNGRITKGYGGNGRPVQCNKIDCPAFTVIHSEKEFEIRKYKQSLWVTGPSVVQSSIEGGADKGGEILYNYYFTGNDAGMDIMESNRGPVLMVDVLKNTYKVYYYVPNQYQDGSIPEPLDPDIVQVTLPKSRYAAVRRINGDVTHKNVLSQVATLRTYLKRSTYKRAANRNQYTYVMYDSVNWGQGYEILIWFD